MISWRVGRSIKIEAPGNSNLKKVWESTVTGKRTLSLIYTEYPNWKWETKSYHICNREEGGSSLNVEILSNDPVDGLMKAMIMYARVVRYLITYSSLKNGLLTIMEMQ